ncbi:flagellar hook-length control protein FliK [Lysinibacillus sp. BW-2-10]|uniref:flagellar hook-length control protein FliK n=1 Tax=Lysinibacillus sp. BW-2-10 TaxID=2590030 RepID=UPI00117F3C13|nr:flagellar hook-length control protein FliK [Lysinibacillus sp. BW-2-10]TSI11406.1 flagellar hook-length control protein FliK [Lysinibacillus sp. BW-2-10]
MNIGTMPLANIQRNSNLASQNTQVASSKKNSFGDIFNEITTSPNNMVATIDKESEKTVNLDELESLLNANSLEEMLNLLGIHHNEGLSLIGVNEEEVISVDEAINNMEELLSMLNVSPEELEATLKELLNEGDLEFGDIWDIVNVINEQSSKIIPPMLSALNGEHHVTPKAIEKLIQVLKLSQTIGNNTDLLDSQRNQLLQLKEVLKFISTEVTNKIATNQEAPRNKANNLLLFANVQGQMVLNGDIKKLVSTNEEKVSLLQSNINGISKAGDEVDGGTSPNTIVQTTTTKSVNIILPVEKSGQSEALAKEMQNLINRSQMSNTQGTMKLLVRLYPENLGSIRIEIFQKDGVLSARLLASTPHTKELLDNQIQQLKSSFAQQNIQMDRIDIAQSLQETDRNNRDQSQFNNLFKQNQSKEDDTSDDNDEEEDSISFSEYLLNEEV